MARRPIELVTGPLLVVVARETHDGRDDVHSVSRVVAFGARQGPGSALDQTQVEVLPSSTVRGSGELRVDLRPVELVAMTEMRSA